MQSVWGVEPVRLRGGVDSEARGRLRDWDILMETADGGYAICVGPLLFALL